MPIYIEEINARGLGPLSEFQARLKRINLIFGKNEYGKTFLVEFLIRSLFKNTKGFNLRQLIPSGKIKVSGLETEPCTFSPTSRRKLEDYWVDDMPGMPANVARLLVVKGAELELERKAQGGVNKSAVKSFLSTERTLDIVEGKIQSTVREASIEEGVILGAHRGDLKKRNDVMDRLLQIEDLLEKVDREYSAGILTSLYSQERELNERISRQMDAKRYLANIKSKEKEKLGQDINFLEEKGFPKLADDYDKLLRKNAELERKEGELNEQREKIKHYQWLTSAVAAYESFLNQGAAPQSRINLILATFFSVGAMLCALLGFLLSLISDPVVGTIFFGVVSVLIILFIIFGFLFYKQQKKRESLIAKSEELKRIEASYQEKLGDPLTDFATLKSKQQSMQEDYQKACVLEDDVEKLKNEIELLKNDIKHGFTRLNFPEGDESKWGEQIAELQNTLNLDKNKLQKLQVELANLDIEPDNYLYEDPGIEFEKHLLLDSERELLEIKQRIQEEERKFDLLKTEIRSTISDRTSTTWDELLDKLRLRHQELVKEYKEITSRILAGILVAQVIDEARQKEDEKIASILQSSIVQRPLFAITKKYNQVVIEGEEIRVSDRFDEFNVADLSTGAREQILLALRIGFASRIMGKESAFLILDDAFQHSDWTRREYSINTIMDLAKNDWQIIYLSMDNHIKDLFNNVVKREFGKEYKFYDLTSEIAVE